MKTASTLITVKDPITNNPVIVDTNKLTDLVYEKVLELGLLVMLSHPEYKKTLLSQINEITL